MTKIPDTLNFFKMKNDMDNFTKFHFKNSRGGISGAKLINRISHAIYIKFIKVSRQKCSWSQDPEIKEWNLEISKKYNIIQYYISNPEINLKIISANQGSQNPLTNESYSLNMYKMSYSVQVNLYKKILFYPSFSHCN